jgi:DNA-binding transcriptional MocR family regulator
MSDVVQKWGQKVAERGFAQIPTYLLNLNRFLDSEHRLSPVELLVLYQLVGSWWKKAENPFPSMATLANRCGVSQRQVQRAINNLDRQKLIARIKRKNSGIIASNAYSLEPLVTFLGKVAASFPNEYPRRVTKEDRVKLSAALGPKHEPSDAEAGFTPEEISDGL